MWNPNKHYKHILAIDPSGDHTKGKGTTGFCHLDTTTKAINVFDTKAIDFKDKEAYWDKIIDTISNFKLVYGDDIIIVVEDYILYAEKAQEQSYSLLETPRLLGIIQWHCYVTNTPCYFEFASVVKHRWTNNILKHKGYIDYNNKGTYVNNTICSRHCIDAVRHAVHYDTFINKKGK